MRRFHLFEIHDQSWCPRSLREGVTDFLRFGQDLTGQYKAVAPLLRTALARTGARRIVDLCSGGGGPWRRLHAPVGSDGAIPVCLTDRHPNRPALERACEAAEGALSAHPDPVDATAVPAELTGLRTLFTSFHHFPPTAAREILADAVAQRQGIAIFEFTHRSVLGVLCMLPAFTMVLLSAPFIRPFRWTRLFWAYLVPLLPFVTVFDGIVSSLRTYSPDDLRALTAGLGDDYVWEAEEVRAPFAPIPTTYLIGYPSDATADVTDAE
ncbi:MAG: class I SAM-dependent methyltransferase [bacterium]|nr:class I SAM-dependent methyltransferase [bacterium]